jgi:uncharacterized protein (TIGR02452 family)
MTRDERVAIYENTVRIVKKGFYVSPKGKEIEITDTDKMVDGTKFYGKKVVIDYDSLPKHETKIEVIDNDCLYAAKDLIDKGLNPCVLNMASFHTPGGGVTRGSSAQEESIFRRTNIFKSLYQFNEIGSAYGIKQREERYPLDYNFGGIYTPSVTVFKASEGDDCILLEEPYKIGVVSVAAVKNPRVENGKLVPWVVDTLKCKIRQILDIALENGHDSIVLSAFGCGAYKTPPTEMARLFKEILSRDDYKNAFKAISFAIINVKSTNGEHNPQGNFEPFRETFS